MTAPLNSPPIRDGYSLRGAARAFGIDRAHLQRAVASGELPASRLGRRRLVVLRDDVLAFIRAHRVLPSAPAGSDREAHIEHLLARDRARGAR